MSFTQAGNNVGISNEAIEELEMDCACQLSALNHFAQPDNEFSQIYVAINKEFNKLNADYRKAVEDRLLSVKESSTIILDTDVQAALEFKGCKSIEEKKKDLREVETLQQLKLHELNELKHTFGGNIMEMGQKILQNYEEEFKFKIIELLDKGDNWQISIYFIRNGVAQVQFPVVLTVNTKMNAVVDVKTNLYTSDKLLAWLKKNNGNALLLITNLGKMLDDLLNL